MGEEAALSAGAWRVAAPPRGLALLGLVGPSFIWCAEYIGSGEVILATRSGALLGPAILWAIVVTIGLKCVIGMAGAQWAVITGEGMIHLFDRLPGPRHWMVWLTLAVQVPAAVVSVGALAKVAGVFLHSFWPLPYGPYVWGVLASGFAVAVAWSGGFGILKAVMSALVFVIIVGVFYVAVRTMPPLAEAARGLVGMLPLEIPAWAPEPIRRASAWHEVLPMMGWAAGGFASQVWYSYWVLGAGYGMAAGRGWGFPADLGDTRSLTQQDGRRLRGWCRLVWLDATVAACIGIAVTTGFALAGAGVLRAVREVPAGNAVAITLSRVFSERWGGPGARLFLLAGSAAMVSTLIGQLSGWPRLLSDGVSVMYPRFAQMVWKKRLRMFLGVFVVTNLLGVLLFDPVRFVQLGAQLDGILLTPIQAAMLLVGFRVVLPKVVSREAAAEVRLGPVLSGGLLIATLVFGVLCVRVLPEGLRAILAGP